MTDEQMRRVAAAYAEGNGESKIDDDYLVFAREWVSAIVAAGFVIRETSGLTLTNHDLRLARLAVETLRDANPGSADIAILDTKLTREVETRGLDQKEEVKT